MPAPVNLSTCQRVNSRRELAQHGPISDVLRHSDWLDNFNVDVDETRLCRVSCPICCASWRKTATCCKAGTKGAANSLSPGKAGSWISESLRQQGLRPNEVLRVTVRAPKPVLQLRRDDQAHDVLEKEELYEGDDIIVGRSTLRFHISQHREGRVRTPPSCSGFDKSRFFIKPCITWLW